MLEDHTLTEEIILRLKMLLKHTITVKKYPLLLWKLLSQICQGHRNGLIFLVIHIGGHQEKAGKISASNHIILSSNTDSCPTYFETHFK